MNNPCLGIAGTYSGVGKTTVRLKEVVKRLPFAQNRNTMTRTCQRDVGVKWV